MGRKSAVFIGNFSESRTFTYFRHVFPNNGIIHSWLFIKARWYPDLSYNSTKYAFRMHFALQFRLSNHYQFRPTKATLRHNYPKIRTSYRNFASPNKLRTTFQVKLTEQRRPESNKQLLLNSAKTASSVPEIRKREPQQRDKQKFSYTKAGNRGS